MNIPYFCTVSLTTFHNVGEKGLGRVNRWCSCLVLVQLIDQWVVYSERLESIRKTKAQLSLSSHRLEWVLSSDYGSPISPHRPCRPTMFSKFHIPWSSCWCYSLGKENSWLLSSSISYVNYSVYLIFFFKNTLISTYFCTHIDVSLSLPFFSLNNKIN